jgi:hypothetical protein
MKNEKKNPAAGEGNVFDKNRVHRQAFRDAFTMRPVPVVCNSAQRRCIRPYFSTIQSFLAFR